jgi:hypothetical protein
VDQEIALPDHQAVEYRLRIAENEPDLRVTMAYTDPLGTITAAKALVNDLDLIVIAPDGKRYFGNHGLLEGNVSREVRRRIGSITSRTSSFTSRCRESGALS